MTQKKANILVLAGGISPEREVSLRSGKNCHAALERQGYPCQFLDFKGKEDVQKIIGIDPDGIFLTTHGTGGEDGAIQGLLDWLNIPYTGSGLEASAICMDKYLSKLLLKEAQLPVAPGCLWKTDLNFNGLCSDWKTSALFVKPRRGGSSVGAGILKSPNDYETFQKNPDLLIEPYTPGKEVTVGYLQQEDGKWQCLPMLELRPKKEFYDYEAKYTEGLTEFILPAEIDKETQEKLSVWGEQALNACEVKGVGRVDFIITEESITILEINTLPGMTNTSDLPAQAKHAGIPYDQLVEKILLNALN